MSEEEALAWLAEQGWGEERYGERLRSLAELIIVENDRQNLIAASTVPHLWARHIVDSAQLLPLAGDGDGEWIDLGSGGGFPGLVIACLRDAPILLVETRGLRARFLEYCIDALSLGHCHVRQAKVEQVSRTEPAAMVSARAFASLDRTLGVASHLCDEKTVWLLPKGRGAQLELESARQQWQAVFHVEQSVTDIESAIIVARDVKRRRATRAERSGRSRKP